MRGARPASAALHKFRARNGFVWGLSSPASLLSAAALARWRVRRLRIPVAALAILTALSTYAAVAEKPSGLAQAPKVAKAAQVVQGASLAAPAVSVPAASTPTTPATTPRVVTPAPTASTGSPAGQLPVPLGLLTAVPPARSSSTPATPSAVAGGPVGRSNPFAPPGFALPPPTPAVPTFGLDLPLPPGAAGPMGSGAVPPPPPGAGMSVGAILGGSERVAIIRAGGQVYVVGAGDTVGDASVVSVRDDKVVMKKGGVTFELPYGGGGQ